MSKLSYELISSEEKKWRKINKSQNNTDSFGKYMNGKYNLDDKELEKEKSPTLALLILLKKHAKEFK